MAEYIECRRCDSRNCDGCNNFTLVQMFHKGKFDCLLDEHNSINPAADVKLVKYGRWVEMVEREHDDYTGEYWDEVYYNCLECDYASDWKAPYCPNCGADMREDST